MRRKERYMTECAIMHLTERDQFCHLRYLCFCQPLFFDNTLLRVIQVIHSAYSPASILLHIIHEAISSWQTVSIASKIGASRQFCLLWIQTEKVKHGGFHIIAEGGAEYIHDFAERGVGFHRFDNSRHGILGAVARDAGCPGRVSLLIGHVHCAHERDGPGALVRHLVNVECWYSDIAFNDVIVDTDDSTLMQVYLHLVAIGGLGDLALEEAVQNTSQHATERVNAIDVVQRRRFGLVGKFFDKVGGHQAGQRY